ncbi:MAG: TfuA domain-containing protein [Kofleriaceae bacterium]
MKTIVFVGPSLPAAEVRALVPGADVRPPASVGEILDLALAVRRPARIALIDGYFERMAAVWHKELLLALERGIAVYGAASMGALRAAELAPFGMIGVGAIYKAFVRGELIADDEVAVAHLPAEQGYRSISDALVTIRHNLALARSARLITKASHDRLLASARAAFYRDRTWAALVAAEPALARHALVDLKAADARALLAALARNPRAPKRPVAVPRTWALRQLIAVR